MAQQTPHLVAVQGGGVDAAIPGFDGLQDHSLGLVVRYPEHANAICGIRIPLFNRTSGTDTVIRADYSASSLHVIGPNDHHRTATVHDQVLAGRPEQGIPVSRLRPRLPTTTSCAFLLSRSSASRAAPSTGSTRTATSGSAHATRQPFSEHDPFDLPQTRQTDDGSRPRAQATVTGSSARSDSHACTACNGARGRGRRERKRQRLLAHRQAVDADHHRPDGVGVVGARTDHDDRNVRPGRHAEGDRPSATWLSRPAPLVATTSSSACSADPRSSGSAPPDHHPGHRRDRGAPDQLGRTDVAARAVLALRVTREDVRHSGDVSGR